MLKWADELVGSVFDWVVVNKKATDRYDRWLFLFR
jgi:hypothetical protein